MAQVSFSDGASGTSHGYGKAACDALGSYIQNAGGAGADIVNYMGTLGTPETTFLDEPEKGESVSNFPLIYIRPGAAVVGFEDSTRVQTVRHSIRVRVFDIYSGTGDNTEGIGRAMDVAYAIASLVNQTQCQDGGTDWQAFYVYRENPEVSVSDPGTITHDTGTLVYVDVDVTYLHGEDI